MADKSRTWRQWWNKIGPGIITGASDDDPSGILTYLQVGVVMGVRGLWLALLTLPLMSAVQEMCARLGLITGQGLLSLIKRRYNPWLVKVVAVVAVAVIVFNIGADLLAIGVVVERLVGWPRELWIILTSAVIIIFTLKFSYRQLANFLKWLTLSLFFYVAVALSIHLNWSELFLHTIRPQLNFNITEIMLIAAVFGTTISPYLFFWQASEEVEEREESIIKRSLKRFTVTKQGLKNLRQDTILGMSLSNLIMWFIIASAATLASRYNLNSLETFDQAALVLEPLLGQQAYLAFATGIVGTGLLAIPVLAGSVGYILSETFGWQEGMAKPFHQARGFHLAIALAVLLGLFLAVLKFDPIKMLIYTAFAYAMITPPLIWFILRLSSDRVLTKGHVNGWLVKVLGYLALFVSLAIVLFYLYL
ncbi:divalent metal cation transporter [Patescibacteria group bacterium]|nr:divalent metal cation transporter [Patescibacteria group bacterium]